MDLRYDAIEAFRAGEKGHPQRVMQRLGITYRLAIPQSIGDQWWFHDCVIRDAMPDFLSEMTIGPEWVGKQDGA